MTNMGGASTSLFLYLYHGGRIMGKKVKIDPEQETKIMIEANNPAQEDIEARRDLVNSMVSLFCEYRDSLPPSSNRYHKALQSIILALNTYIRYDEHHIGIWNGFEHLCMAYTAYSHLIWCTEKKSENRDSNTRMQLNLFLKEMQNLWKILLSQYLDFETKH